ncbi:hypothetical protein [Mesorhizobium denitrificans]|uniref:Uncharacterized protein n=1 Tax=Mesorhizobium denitrificans TaxID=2294114 RepID=A0A371XEZ0_9HYPH|nr:hypothetical protein [Mesorhizobium denitrificans]RFC67797.1 hypothetical protein DY251_09395 [Mesorhizobium denitrificans]
MRLTNERVATALHNAGGIVAQAAKLLGCSRQSVYVYLSENPELQALRERIETDLLNRAKDRVAEGIRNGELEASLVYLSAKSKTEAIRARVEIVTAD